MSRKHTHLAVSVLVLVAIAPGVSNGADPGVVGWWTFDDGTPTDISGNALDGVLLGNAEIVTDSKRGEVLQVNQSGMQVGGPFDITTSFTLSAWIKLDLPRTGRYYFGGPWWFRTDNQGGTEHHWIEVRYPEGNFLNKIDTRVADNPQGQLDGQWHHLVLILPEDGAFEGYFDGVVAPFRDADPVRVHDFGGSVGPLFFGTQDEAGANAISGYMDDIRVFNYAINEDEVQAIMSGAGLAGVEFPLARRPAPEDGAMIEATWVTLSWRAGDYAVSHDVYIGDDPGEVAQATPDSPVFQGNQGDTTLIAGFPGFAFQEGLVPGTTYYWRIDEVNDTNADSPWKGDVWSFSVPPKTAYNPNPADGAEFVELNTNFTWTGGYGAKLHTVYLGDNYEEIDSATVGQPSGTASHDPGTLEREKVLYWRVDEFDGAETHKGDIWTFTTPGAVGNPQPANGEVDVQLMEMLSWTAADNAVSHELYFGADADAVKNATTGSSEYVGPRALGSESYDPGGLAWDSSCAWRVDEVYPTGTVKGLVWTFNTADFIVVDDFESYDDIDPASGEPGINRIFDKWIDGFGTTTNGALVGNDLPPYAEQNVVHGGTQSMIYRYDNAGKTSEATLTLVYPRDWTEEGVTKLSLWHRGASANAPDRLFVALNGTAVVYHDDPAATNINGWKQWVIDLQVFGVNLTNVNTTTIGVGTKNTPAPTGGTGTMYFDDIRLIR